MNRRKPVGRHLLLDRVGAGTGQEGQATAFVVGAFAAAWLFAGIVVDGGLAMAASSRAQDIAQEAARTGAQQLDLTRLRHGELRLNSDEAQTAAHRYVTSTGDTGTVSVHDTTVTVRVTHQQHTQILHLIGLRTLTAHGDATAHAERHTP